VWSMLSQVAKALVKSRKVEKSAEQVAKIGRFSNVAEAIGSWWRGHLPPQNIAERAVSFTGKIDELKAFLKGAPADIKAIVTRKIAPVGRDLTTEMKGLKSSAAKLDRDLAYYTSKLPEVEARVQEEANLITRLKSELARIPEVKKQYGAIDPAEIKDPSVKTMLSQGYEGKLEDRLRSALTSFDGAQGRLKQIEDSIEVGRAKSNYVKLLQGDMGVLQTKLDAGDLPAALEHLDALDAKYAEYGASVYTELPNAKQWASNVKNLLEKHSKDISGSVLTSRNIGLNDLDFLEEAARVRAKSPVLWESWSSNPENMANLNKLTVSTNKKISALANDIKHEFKNSADFRGLSPRDIANRLKIPGAAGTIASLAGGFAVLNWFSRESPHELGAAASSIKSKLQGLRVQGNASTMVSDTTKALDGVIAASNSIASDFGDNPAEVMKSGLQTMLANITTIAQHTDNWDVVTAASNDKDLSAAIKASLSALVSSYVEKVNKLPG
jgi:hypothetical protein